jgi:hypothetical protein
LGGDAVVRSTERHNEEAGRSPDELATENVETLRDDEELIVDGFQRVSIFGLEVGMVDGPLRVRTLRRATGRESRP